MFKSQIKKIQRSGWKTVMAITGGGTGAINQLLHHGGGSVILLEAPVVYEHNSLTSFLRGKPDKPCCLKTARDMAMAAFQRAAELSGTYENMVGVGATVSLVKDDDEREGREHNIYIATQTCDATTWYEARLDNAEWRKATGEHFFTREEEEDIASDAILTALAEATGSITEVDLVMNGIGRITRAASSKAASSHYWSNTDMRSVVIGKKHVVPYGGRPLLKLDPEDEIIFPGSFNPIHEQHIKMAMKAHELTGKKVSFEICVKNVDKPALNYYEIIRRLSNLVCTVSPPLSNMEWLGNFYLTNTGTFAEKSAEFPGRTFLMGWDTYERLNQRKYGNLDEIATILSRNGAKFLVFHRIINGIASHDTDLAIEHDVWAHPTIFAATTIVPPEVLTVSDMSSSDLRKK